MAKDKKSDDTTMTELDLTTQALFEAANGEDDLEPLVEPEEDAVETVVVAPEPTPSNGLISQLLSEMQANPAGRKAVFEELAKDPTIRKQMGLKAGQGQPQGDYRRNYAAEPALRVFGGVEVAHEPGFEPLPPSFIQRYVADAGGKTDDPALATWDETGKPIKTPEYKVFIDHHLAGTKMDGKVRFDIAADNFTPGDTGVAIG